MHRHWQSLMSLLLCRIMLAAFTSLAVREAVDASARTVPISTLEWLGLLRVLSIGRLARAFSRVANSRRLSRLPVLAVFLPVAMLMYLFVLMAHYLGLVWYMISIRPMEADEEYDSLRPWFWTEGSAYSAAVQYICALYWALSVMTNLKGLPAHESRQCLYSNPEVYRPLEERIYTICVFIAGAVFFSVIYGNIGQFIQNLYSAGLRYRQRMKELDEFAEFHRISPPLQAKLRHYVSFKWAVTKGIDIDTMAGGLPAHLHLEIRLQLYKPMVEKVCPSRLEYLMPGSYSSCHLNVSLVLLSSASSMCCKSCGAILPRLRSSKVATPYSMRSSWLSSPHA